MDCCNNQRNSCTCRPQMPVPPCMNTNCDCGCGHSDIQPRQIRPMQPMAPEPCSCQTQIRPAQSGCQPQMRPEPRAIQPQMRLEQPQIRPAQMKPEPCGCQTPIMPASADSAISPAMMPPLCTNVREDRMSGMPIAMAYVPWQRWKQTYSLEQGLNRGTIFPELDLPFVMGRCRG